MPEILSLHQSVGSISFPISADDVTDSLAVFDPARDRLLALFKAALNAEIGEAWTKVTNQLSGSALCDTLPIQDTLPHEPRSEIMQELKCGFPLLALHRHGKPTFPEYTLNSFQRVQEWQMHYILPQLDIMAKRRVKDVFTIFSNLVALIIRQRGHAAYDGGALQFFPGKGGLSSVELIDVEGPMPASFSDEDSATFEAMLFTLQTTETPADYLDGFPTLEGADANINAGTNELVKPLVEVSTSPKFQYP